MTFKVSAALAVALLAFLLWLYRRDANVTSRLQLDDFLLGDDGRASKAALVMYVALAVSSYVVILQTVRDTLTDLVFGAYLAAWVAPTVTRMITSSPGTPVQTTNITTGDVAAINAPAAPAVTPGQPTQ